MPLFDKVLLKFILVGLINTIVGSAIMFGLYNFAGLSYWISTGANYILTSILSFFLNKFFTFQAKGKSAREVVAFCLTIIVSYIIAYSAAKPLMYYLLAGYSQKIQDNISMFTGMCFFTAINYLGQRFVAFKK
ncbi:hypothetical protein FACS189447_04330 [Spirochaetia bacterium]|nr:hypothetical protein FACS189447_04330 [Spirochaetia bacterium]